MPAIPHLDVQIFRYKLVDLQFLFNNQKYRWINPMFIESVLKSILISLICTDKIIEESSTTLMIFAHAATLLHFFSFCSVSSEFYAIIKMYEEFCGSDVLVRP